MEFLYIVFLLIGIVIGFFIGKLLKPKQANNNDVLLKLEELTNENGVLKGRVESATQVYKNQQEKIKELETNLNTNIIENSTLTANNKALTEKLHEQKEELTQLQDKFTKDFQLIANKLLKENSSEFAQTNHKKLDEILSPLKERIKTFEQKVEEKYEKELKERSTLLEQIRTLKELNTQMSDDAKSLTKALKGDSKAQGNWGELILEKILENSGLTKGEEYQTEDYYTNQTGGGSRLDVIIKLPENKQIIIDSKVSITAYTNYLDAKNDQEREEQLKAHLNSVKTHIDTLSKKDYSQIPGLNTPDFVLMFMPSEPSFGFTLQNEPNIYNYAWDKKIVIVSPTTLLATLKTVASLWKQERQTKNAIEIARQAGALHDKFYNFVVDMKNIKRHIDKSSEVYDSAFKKLKLGRGNLIDATIRLQKLGAKTTKQFDTDEFLTEGDE